MSEAQPKLSSAKVAFAILGAVTLLFVGCVQISTEGRAFEVRGNNELFGGICFIAGAGLAFGLYRIAFKSTASFSLHDDRVEHHRWKWPIYFRDVDEVVLEPAEFLARRRASVYFRLKNGSIQHIPYSLMTHGPAEFAELLTDALKRYRATEAA